MKPRIIWLDDDIHASNLRGTVALFRKHFDIIECETINEFREKSQSFEWDAAILDVLNADEKAVDLFNSLRIVGEGKIWFVFSGKPEVTKNDKFEIIELLKGKEYSRSYSPKPIYEKGEHDEELIRDVENAVKNQRIWQVENEYETVLKIADKYIDDRDCRKHLLDILCAASGASVIDSHLYYNRIRVILEWMFRSARKYGFLHDKCFDAHNKINLTDASLFLSGKDTKFCGVRCKIAHFPHIIAENVKNILFITGGASHTTEVEDKDIPNLTNYWKEIDSPYLLYSIAFMLCDILLWYDKYVTEHPDIDENKKNWEVISSVNDQSSPENILSNYQGYVGDVEMDTSGNYHVGDCLLPYKSQPVGTRLKLIKIEVNTKSTNKIYPGFIAKYEIVN